MIVIVAGPRPRPSITYQVVCDAIAASGFTITHLVSGHAPGVDLLGEKWALKHGVPITSFPAQWEEFGRRAGPLRNQEMLDYVMADADRWDGAAVIAVWDSAAVDAGRSKGTPDMVGRAERAGVTLYVHRI